MVATVTPSGFIVGFPFQSAFHRGSGCYRRNRIYEVPYVTFQSAFHRGNGCYRICYARVVLILSPSPWDLLSPSLSTQLIAFHRGNGCYRICYARVVLILSPSPWDLLSPSLSTQLIAFHRGSGCYRGKHVLARYVTFFQSAFHRGSGCYD